MKAVVMHGYGDPDALRYEEAPDPRVTAGVLLVRVVASSVNPFDFKIRSGAMRQFVPLTFPAILGFDVSGIVEAVGSGVTGFAPGDKVFAHTNQAYAELCVVQATDAAKVPSGMDVAEVAALPTVTTTGYQLANLALSGNGAKSVLVTGAIGNVGRSAVFTAKSRGLRVVAGVLRRQADQARMTGVDEVLALDDAAAVAAFGPVDAVADTVGGPTAEVLIGKIASGGVFASVLGVPANAAQFPGVTAKAMQVTADAAALVTLAEAVKSGKLSIPIGARFDLRDAAKAHAKAEKGSAGKILLIA